MARIHSGLFHVEQYGYAPTPPSIWQVAFLGETHENPFDIVNPPGFRHCIAFAYCAAAKAWIVVDPRLHALDLMVIPEGEPMIAYYESLMEQKATIVRIMRREKTPAWRHRLFYTCVTAAKQAIGARSGALRPIGLFRDLVRQGGKILFWKGALYENQGQGAAGRRAHKSVARADGSAGRTGNHFRNAAAP